MSNRAQTRQLIRSLEKQGFEVERTKGGHWRVTRPGDKRFVTMAFSPSSKGQHLTLKRLKALGYDPGGK